MIAWAASHGWVLITGWPLPWLILGFLIAQRLGELAYAHRNTKALLADGGQEYGAGHYPVMIAIHSGFLATLVVTTPPFAPIIWPLALVFMALQAARLWVLATLGQYWTTRIISAPSFPRVRRGPFRLVNHPNYAVVTAEIATIPLIFGHIWIAIVFSLCNAAILYVRVTAEARALKERTG